MKVTYDKTVDAMYIELRARAKSARTVRAGDDVAIDYDTEGRAIGVEILNASHHLGKAGVAKLPSAAEELSLAEAADRSDPTLSTETLRWAIHAGKLPARKRGRDWVVTAAALLNYQEAVESGREKAVPPEKKPSRRRRAQAVSR